MTISIGLCLLGYLSGSLPFSIWITRVVKKVDVRDSGSGHATTTNTIRQAGWIPGLVVLVFDFLKGYLPTWLALRYSTTNWVPPVVAALAVVGHCWPLFADFRGGMGLATAGGGLFAAGGNLFFIGLAMLILLVLIMRHSARAALFTGVLMAPLFYVIGARGMVIWLATASGSVLAIRFFSDWNRKYRELWLDREKQTDH